MSGYVMSGYEADTDSDSEVESLLLLQDETSSSTESRKSDSSANEERDFSESTWTCNSERSPFNVGCSLDVIQRKCAEVVLPVLSEEQLQRIQREIAKQSKSKLWFRLWSGRITASRFKQACSTDFCNPSKSLIKAICYPTECIFTSDAVAWGLEMESIAEAAYKKAFFHMKRGQSMQQEPSHKKMKPREINIKRKKLPSSDDDYEDATENESCYEEFEDVSGDEDVMYDVLE
eukprot:gene5617-10828_t